ncbi:MAG TPA: thioredoxin domain-containing protein [Solirubrobacterales bacterium]
MSAPDEREAEARRDRLVKLASATAFLAVVVVAVLVVIDQSQTDGGDTSLEGVAAVRSDLDGIPQRGLVLGDPRAEVVLVEFGDLQCPACKGFAEDVVPDVIESKVRSGEARIEFRNFTIIGEESVDAAAAAVAAGEQGRGWHFVELFYRNQGFERSGYVSDEFLTELARAAGVRDIELWHRTRRSQRTIDRVEAESAEAEELGFGGTPSFAVQGPATDGLKTLGTPGTAGELESAIDAAR